MTKPLWRWTCGNCTQQGLEILEESVFRALKIFGEDNWDWMICHNGMTPPQLQFLQAIAKGRPITLYEQSWSDCPIDDEMWSPIRADGTIEVDGGSCGGTLWKACPARMRIDAHEIVMDNDLVLLKKLPQIEEFLRSYKTLILEEPVRYYGRFAALIPLEDHINSGFMGFPPGFDFGKAIRQTWEENGQHRKITQEDEQGLLMCVLQNHPNIRINKYEVRELLAGDPPKIIGDEYGCHFVQSNRTSLHRSWLQYKQIFHDTIPLV